MVCVTLVFLSQWLLFVHYGNTEPSRHKLLLRSRGGEDSRRGLRSKKRVVEVFLLDDHTGPYSRTPLCLFLTLVTWMQALPGTKEVLLMSQYHFFWPGDRTMDHFNVLCTGSSGLEINGIMSPGQLWHLFSSTVILAFSFPSISHEKIAILVF